MKGRLFCYKTPELYQMSLFNEGPEPHEGSVVLAVEEKDLDYVVVLSPIGSHMVLKKYLVPWKTSALETL